MRPELGSDASFVTVKPCNSGASANMHDPHNAQSSCHVHAVWRRCVCPLIGATATSKYEVFDFATDETATLHESYTKKRPIFDHRLRFSMWSRQKNYDTISLKPMIANLICANWQTKRQSSCATSQVLAWTITNSRKKNLNQLENCQKYAHKLS